MRTFKSTAAAVALLAAVFASPASASPTADLQDFVGAKGGQAEMGLQNLGYQSTRVSGLTAYWWNSSKNTCAKIVTSKGRYRTIDTVPAASCGQSGGPATGPGAGCPADVSQANRHQYPDCDKPSAAGSGDVPQAVLDACMARADEFQGVARGTSMASGATLVGANWVLQMASGTYKSTCTASAAGRVINMSAGY